MEFRRSKTYDTSSVIRDSSIYYQLKSVRDFKVRMLRWNKQKYKCTHIKHAYLGAENKCTTFFSDIYVKNTAEIVLKEFYRM